MVLRCRSVVARASLREEQPGPGLRAQFLHHQLDPHLAPWLSVEHFHMCDERRGARAAVTACTVTYLFEDSRAGLIARVDDGPPLRVAPGGLFWLEGGAGAQCEMVPESASVHGVRMCFHGGGTDRRTVALAAADIPEVEARGARVRVLAGDALGARAPLTGALTVLDVHLAPGAEVAHVTPKGHHAWAIAIIGDGFAGPEDSEMLVKQSCAVAFGHDGDTVRLRAGSAGLHAIFAHAPGRIRSEHGVASRVQQARE